MKQFLLIVFISVLSFNQTSAQESKVNVDTPKAVSSIKARTVVLMNIKKDVGSAIVLNKKAFKKKINLKLKGQIDLFKVKRRYNLC